MSIGSLSHIRIEAPDGSAALELERRLAHLAPTTISHRGSWLVELPAAPDHDEVEAVVRRWLDDIGATATEVHVDGRSHHVVGNRVRRVGYRGPNADFIG